MHTPCILHFGYELYALVISIFMLQITPLSLSVMCVSAVLPLLLLLRLPPLSLCTPRKIFNTPKSNLKFTFDEKWYQVSNSDLLKERNLFQCKYEIFWHQIAMRTFSCVCICAAPSAKMLNDNNLNGYIALCPCSSFKTRLQYVMAPKYVCHTFLCAQSYIILIL